MVRKLLVATVCALILTPVLARAGEEEESVVGRPPRMAPRPPKEPTVGEVVVAKILGELPRNTRTDPRPPTDDVHDVVHVPTAEGEDLYVVDWQKQTCVGYHRLGLAPALADAELCGEDEARALAAAAARRTLGLDVGGLSWVVEAVTQPAVSRVRAVDRTGWVPCVAVVRRDLRVVTSCVAFPPPYQGPAYLPGNESDAEAIVARILGELPEGATTTLGRRGPYKLGYVRVPSAEGETLYLVDLEARTCIGYFRLGLDAPTEETRLLDLETAKALAARAASEVLGFDPQRVTWEVKDLPEWLAETARLIGVAPGKPQCVVQVRRDLGMVSSCVLELPPYSEVVPLVGTDKDAEALVGRMVGLHLVVNTQTRVQPMYEKASVPVSRRDGADWRDTDYYRVDLAEMRCVSYSSVGRDSPRRFARLCTVEEAKALAADAAVEILGLDVTRLNWEVDGEFSSSRPEAEVRLDGVDPEHGLVCTVTVRRDLRVVDDCGIVTPQYQGPVNVSPDEALAVAKSDLDELGDVADAATVTQEPRLSTGPDGEVVWWIDIAWPNNGAYHKLPLAYSIDAFSGEIARRVTCRSTAPPPEVGTMRAQQESALKVRLLKVGVALAALSVAALGATRILLRRRAVRLVGT